MKRIITFFMLCAFISIGMRAAITITPANDIYVGGTTYSGYGIYGAKAGEIAQLLNGTYAGTVYWDGATLNDLKSAVLIKVGSSSNPNILNDDDLAALELLSGARFLDIDGSVLAEGANIANIKAGSSIEAVTLPNGLPKADVNAAGAALKYCNSKFGSCMSLDAEMVEKELTTYTYINPCSTDELEYEGTVTDGKGSIVIDRPLTLTSSSFSYTNSKFKNEVMSCSESDIDAEGYVVPNPLKVEVTEVDNPTYKYTYTYPYNNVTYDIPDHAVTTEGVIKDPNGYYLGYFDGNNHSIPYGTQVDVQVTHNYSYTYTFMEGYNEVKKTLQGTPDGDAINGYYTMVANNYSPGNGYRFKASQEYNYTYTDLDCNEATKQYTDGPHETINLSNNYEVALIPHTHTINVPKEGGNTTVVAYVNTPGTLYQATSLDNYDVEVADSLIISGNINNADISVHANATDPSPSTDADAFTTTGATPAFYVNHKQCQFVSIDMSDAVIEDYKHLRVLDSYGNKLETIVFPRNLEKIPNYCCYANGNSGLPNLKNVTFPENLKSIGVRAFCDTALEELVLPGTIQSVGDYAFYTCKKLEIVEMEALTGSCTFGEFVFASSAVKHVTLSEGVDAISAHMFDVCASLESVRIPTTAKTIKTAAFAGCVSLHKLVIPEGVDLLEQSVFNGAGLTDIYVMATSEAKVPKIYCLGTNPFDNTIVGTFTVKNILGNNTSPNKTKDTDYDETTPMETALSWYQEEFSDMNIGIGGNNCMIQLHYPENMASFYNGTANLPEGWLDNLNSLADRELAEWEVAKAEQSGWLSTVYAYGSYEYDKENGTNKGGSSPIIGPTEGGLYWPNQQDYYIRLAAGYSSTGEPTAEAWRQIPLQGITDAEEIIYTKKYDDTWYTMAFPWDMDDNTLFSTFNQKCEIVEFVGAEVFKDPKDEYNYNLVFHFDEVAKTRYMPEDHSAEYRRIVSEHTRTVELTVNGTKTTKNYYTYEDIKTGALVYWPYHTGSSASDAEKEMQKKYNDIMHMMVFAGHPYMIHPAIGAKAGQPKDCTIAGVKKYTPGEKYEGKTYSTLEDLAKAQKVERTVTSNEAGGTSTTAWTNPKTSKGGKYTFIGNINDAVETDGVSDNGVQDMPTANGPVYFLGVKEGTVYPQFFKKPKGKGAKKWSQYSAIIVPDDDAIANVEGLDGMSASSGTATPAKGYDVVFGEWEIVDEATVVTAIENAQAEAEETGKPAQIAHMNVVYNIKGQVVRADSSSVEGLPKGLYIVNGKKYMVK